MNLFSFFPEHFEPSGNMSLIKKVEGKSKARVFYEMERVNMTVILNKLLCLDKKETYGLDIYFPVYLQLSGIIHVQRGKLIKLLIN